MFDESRADDRIERVRAGLAGRETCLETPFGIRPLFYADYTASGRAQADIEAVIAQLAVGYANPHSEDSATGRASNAWMREAERIIKAAVNAGPGDCLLPCAAGATGAIHKLQEILGLAIPPATRSAVGGLEAYEADTVVFVGPYEHHSNELTWRESLAETVTIPLADDGGIDLGVLADALSDPRHAGKRKIGAFSAASNVTGVRTDVKALARCLHAQGAMLCLDCAASAPYLPIDMHPDDDPESAIDAAYFSPHKFVGGPGSCGILLFNGALYPEHLPPTLCGGGTVRYVWPGGHDFIDDIEARERAGTPGLPQFVRAALAMKLQSEVGYGAIAAREHRALETAFAHWQAHPRIEILGPADPERRIGIVSFNLKTPRGDRVSPRLVTVLLNDLFGIQSRAGCSCAGPYGHYLLGIDEEETMAIRERVLAGETGARPGWCRVSLHWTMSADDIDYLVSAVDFLADHAAAFARFYTCDDTTGGWSWKGGAPAALPSLPDSILDRPEADVRPGRDLRAMRREAFAVAHAIAARGG
jgi:selenocysteine lyase/cysteine desulfurase